MTYIADNWASSSLFPLIYLVLVKHCNGVLKHRTLIGASKNKKEQLGDDYICWSRIPYNVLPVNFANSICDKGLSPGVQAMVYTADL